MTPSDLSSETQGVTSPVGCSGLLIVTLRRSTASCPAFDGAEGHDRRRMKNRDVAQRRSLVRCRSRPRRCRPWSRWTRCCNCSIRRPLTCDRSATPHAPTSCRSHRASPRRRERRSRESSVPGCARPRQQVNSRIAVGRGDVSTRTRAAGYVVPADVGARLRGVDHHCRTGSHPGDAEASDGDPVCACDPQTVRPAAVDADVTDGEVCVGPVARAGNEKVCAASSNENWLREVRHQRQPVVARVDRDDSRRRWPLGTR